MARGDRPWEAVGTSTRLASALLSPKLFTFRDFQLHKSSALFLHTPRSLRSETGLSYKQNPGQAVSP